MREEEGMLKLYFLLTYEFLKIGVFALGGGYAALPFLFYIQQKYNWFSVDELTNMIAVSNITPGPIGINMATYTGYTTGGLFGSLLATSAIVFVPFLMTIAIIKIFNKYKTCSFAGDIFVGLRPASCALLTSIGIRLLYQTVTYSKEEWSFPVQIDYKALMLFIILLIPFSCLKKNPLLVIAGGAIGGILINLF